MTFSCFVNLCEVVRITRSRNTKVNAIAQYFTKLDDVSLEIVVLLLTGTVFPKRSGLVLNVGINTVMRSLSDIAQLESEEIRNIYVKYGDMGALAEHAVSKRQQNSFNTQRLDLRNLHIQLGKIASATGAWAAETKRKILIGLLLNCSPLEAKYLIKIATGEMRIGVVEGLIELSIAKAFDRKVQAVRKAMLITGDIAHTSILAKKDALSTIVMKPLNPVSFMLADVMPGPEEIVQYYGKPMICEFKYDGVRVQLHKLNDQVKMYSRTLDEVTRSFPEISSAASSTPHDLILDGELVAYKNNRPSHFQELQKRLGRKIVTKDVMIEIPVVYVPYDIVYLDGQSLVDEPLAHRKKLMSKIKFKSPIIDEEYSIVSSAQEITAAFERSRQLGHEGLVLKELESLYHPGKRGKHWAKLKRELDTIDAVIMVAEYGHGKRAGVLSDYTFGVRDGGDSLKVIGKAYSGLSDEEILGLTARLLQITLKNEGYRILVKPEIIIEVAFDSIQKSDRHDSGFALRFPRIKRIRSDKTLKDIDDVEKIRGIFEMQSRRKGK